MDDIQLLREEKVKAAKAVHDFGQLSMKSAEDFNTQGGMTKFNTLKAEHASIDERLKVAEEAVAYAGEEASKQVADERNISLDQAVSQKESAQRDFHMYLLHGRSYAAANAMSDAGRQRYLDAGANLPTRNPQALGDPNDATDTAPGAGSDGVAVPIEVGTSLYTKLKSYSAMRLAGTVKNSPTGRSRVEPIIDNTSQQGVILVPGNSTPDVEMQLSSRTMSFSRFASGALSVEKDWLVDTATAKVIRTVDDLQAKAIERVQGSMKTLKSGAAKNNGLLDDIPVGHTAKNGGGEVTSIKIDSINALMRSVDPAYRKHPGMGMHSDEIGKTGAMNGMEIGMPGFMANDDLISIIQNIKDSEGRPLFVPNFNTGGELFYFKYPFYTNQYFAEPVANAKTMAFGQLSNFIIYDQGMPIVVRYTDSQFTRKWAVGFECFVRSAWRLIDAGDSVKVFQQAAS